MRENKMQVISRKKLETYPEQSVIIQGSEACLGFVLRSLAPKCHHIVCFRPFPSFLTPFPIHFKPLVQANRGISSQLSLKCKSQGKGTYIQSKNLELKQSFLDFYKPFFPPYFSGILNLTPPPFFRLPTLILFCLHSNFQRQKLKRLTNFGKAIYVVVVP